MKDKTKQELFWEGEFGNQYIERNNDEKLVASNTALFSKILNHTENVNSIIEFGANIGLNLKAIKRLLPAAELSGVEINKKAYGILKNNIDKSYNESILDYKTDFQRDFVLIKGVLIHINPEKLKEVYEVLYNSTSKYICIVEYYNPSPVEIPYRGHDGYLFKRDFAGEFMDKYSEVKLVDYGFVYHRDNNFSADDLTWFLLSK